jgi:hypothetical protein
MPMPLGHGLDIGADPFAQGGDLVDEGDLGRQKGVGRVFDHLGRFQPGVDHREFAQEQRAVDLGHHLAGAVAFHPHHHPVGAHEVVDRRALAQELGVRGHVEFGGGVGRAQHLGHLAVGADRHRRLGHHHGIAGQRPPDLFGGGHHIGQVGVAVAAAGGGADGDEHRPAPAIAKARSVVNDSRPAATLLAPSAPARPGS